MEKTTPKLGAPSDTSFATRTSLGGLRRGADDEIG